MFKRDCSLNYYVAQTFLISWMANHSLPLFCPISQCLRLVLWKWSQTEKIKCKGKFIRGVCVNGLHDLKRYLPNLNQMGHCEAWCRSRKCVDTQTYRKKHSRQSSPGRYLWNFMWFEADLGLTIGDRTWSQNLCYTCFNPSDDCIQKHSINPINRPQHVVADLP